MSSGETISFTLALEKGVEFALNVGKTDTFTAYINRAVALTCTLILSLEFETEL